MATQLGSAIAELSQVVIGKVDSIHGTFNTSNPPPQATTNTTNINSRQRAPNKNKKRWKEEGPEAAGPSQSAHPPQQQGNTWATVGNNGKVRKQTPIATPQVPTSPSRKTLITQRSVDAVNKDIDHLHLRNTINHDLVAAKFQESLLATGIL